MSLKLPPLHFKLFPLSLQIMRKRPLFGVLLVLILGMLSSCGKYLSVMRSDDPDLKYRTAMELYEKKKYSEANLLYEAVLPNLKGQDGAEVGSYNNAWCYFYMKQYVMSAFYFREFTETYPRSQYAEEAMFMHAKSLFMDSPDFDLDQTSTTDALRAIQSFANTYYTSSHMEEINSMADKLNFKLEKKAFENAKTYYKIGNYNAYMFKAAVVAFIDFQNSYPNSAFLEEVGYLKLDASYKLAKESFEAVIKKGEKIYLKKDRFYETIEYYNSFIEKFPGSKYKRDAENIYETTLKELNKLKS